MTTASKITLVRVAFIPIYMVLMYLSGGTSGLWMWLALGVFVLASITDYIFEYYLFFYCLVQHFHQNIF